jgi:hypothetical protein
VKGLKLTLEVGVNRQLCVEQLRECRVCEVQLGSSDIEGAVDQSRHQERCPPEAYISQGWATGTVRYYPVVKSLNNPKIHQVRAVITTYLQHPNMRMCDPFVRAAPALTSISRVELRILCLMASFIARLNNLGTSGESP